MKRPPVTYDDGTTPVLLGDHIEVRFFFDERMVVSPTYRGSQSHIGRWNSEA